MKTNEDILGIIYTFVFIDKPVYSALQLFSKQV
jgi:hypothetical protein